MNVFVTGSSGYLGSVLIDRLARVPEVDSITGIDVAPPRTPLPPKAEFKQLDVREPDISKAMANHEVVVHLACVVKWLSTMPKTVLEDINVNGTRNVAGAAAINKVHRFIQMSSIAAYDKDILKGESHVREDSPLGDGNSSFYYGNSKATCEHVLNEILGPTETMLTVFRPSFIVDDRVAEMTNFIREKSVRIRGHNPRLQLVHEEDVASAVELAILTKMPGTYNLVPDDYLRWNEILQLVGRHSPPTIRIWLACLSAGIAWRFFGSPLHSSWIKAICTEFTLSNAKLKATGWTPRHSTRGVIIEALRQTANIEPMAFTSANEKVEATEKPETPAQQA